MNREEHHTYRVTINWDEGRIGTMQSDVLEDKIRVATPPEFPGGVEGLWSPEHLFTASVSSCFMTSFTAIAEYSKFEFESLKVDSEGIMSRQDGKFVMSKVILNPVLTVLDEKHIKKGLRLLEKADTICLITRSINSEVIVNPKVLVASEA